jgi:hypothetical protein
LSNLPVRRLACIEDETNQGSESLNKTTSLSTFLGGLQRAHASVIADGEGNIVVGRNPLGFNCYCVVALSFLKSGGKECVFGHLFMVLCWNLTCRSSNVVRICYSHMEWELDALGIYLDYHWVFI